MEAEMIEEAAAKQRDAGTSGRKGDYEDEEDEGRGVRHNGGSDRYRDDGRRCVFVGGGGGGVCVRESVCVYQCVCI